RVRPLRRRGPGPPRTGRSMRTRRRALRTRRRRSERTGRRACASALQELHGLVEVGVDLFDSGLDHLHALPVLDLFPEGGRDRLLELLHQVLVALTERLLDRLEVLEVGVAD